MRLYSTKNPSTFYSLKEAVMKGLPDDNGLFMPESIPSLPPSFIQNLAQYSFQEIAYEVSKTLLQGIIPEADLQDIINKSIDFPAPLVELDENTSILELFHGPSLAFKDFGARFMAQLMSYFNRETADKELIILVATSGDTGGAVAAGFFQAIGIKVVILYPSGKVSQLQEKQLTTLGHNIAAIEVQGTFDDCQALVKQAFLDSSLTGSLRLSSANSINIARLIPQSFYYFEAFKQLPKSTKDTVFVVPSGNFGNLTAGLFAKKMGLPISHFVAATNANDVVPSYLSTGNYAPRPSVRTLSNAMDVGAPSNFARMLDLYCSTWNNIKADISGYAFNDADTEDAIRRGFLKYKYLFDPHGAVGYLAWKKHRKAHQNSRGIILETAHPAKFLDDMERIMGCHIAIPEALAQIADKPKVAVLMSANYSDFRTWLLENF